MENFFSKIKEHPYITAGIALVGGIILYTAFFSGGSSSSAPSQAQLDAANFATQTQGATQLAVAQAAQQAQQYQVGQEAAVAEAKIASDTTLAQLQASTIQNGQQLQAGVQSSLISGSVQENLANTAAALQVSTLQATVAEQQIAADQAVKMAQASYGYSFGLAELQGAENAPHPTTFTSPFGNYNTGGTYTPPPPPAPAPAAQAVAPNILFGNTGGGVYLEPGAGGLASVPFPVAYGSGAVASSPPPPPPVSSSPTSWFGDTSPAAVALAQYMGSGGNMDSAATVAAESGPYDPFIAAHLPGYDTTFASIYNAIQTQQASSTGPVGH